MGHVNYNSNINNSLLNISVFYYMFRKHWVVSIARIKILQIIGRGILKVLKYIGNELLNMTLSYRCQTGSENEKLLVACFSNRIDKKMTTKN